MKNKIIILLALVCCACGNSTQRVEAMGMDSLGLPADSLSADVQELAQDSSAAPGDNSLQQASAKRFVVVSKLHENLTVFDVQQGDTVQLAQYPACMGKNKGNKQKRGDMKTPESPKGKPFFISQIQDASTWHHDFGDGRGSIKAYGHWFLRLNTPGHSGIGIHGSTNNESTVPGRASEGCIRLRDADIIDLKERFAYVGMPVIVKAEGEE